MAVIQIYIPTLGRAERLRTWDALPPKYRESAYVVCPKAEVEQHESRRVLPCDVKGIVLKRDWILDHAARQKHEHIVMLDDDVTFQARAKDNRLLGATMRETEQALEWLDKVLARYAHAALGVRFLDFRTMDKTKETGRAMHSLAYNVPRVRELGARFSKGLVWNSTMEDINMTLQLLTSGEPNIINLVYRTSPAPSNGAGGCSGWRTTAIQSESARRLAGLFPGLVRTREKKAWKGMEEGMLDVTVYWKKALEKGLSHG
jgi:hypothetical protein